MIEIAQLARGPFCKRDPSTTLGMTTVRSAIKILRRYINMMRRTTISHFSFLISHSSEAFIPNQGAIRPTG